VRSERSGFRVWGLGFGVYDSKCFWFRVQSLRSRVKSVGLTAFVILVSEFEV
jgi:hypothetical protein